MVVCVETFIGLFLRINTEDKWPVPVFLEKVRNPFLSWDSYLQCGRPLEIDDYLIDESVRQRGVLGVIHQSCVLDICAAVRRSPYFRDSDRSAILHALQCSSP